MLGCFGKQHKQWQSVLVSNHLFMSLRPGSKVGQHSAAAERAIMPDRPVWMVCAARVIKKNLHALSTK